MFKDGDLKLHTKYKGVPVGNDLGIVFNMVL